MARHSSKTRERARELYLTGETTSVAEIARRLRIKGHTVGLLRKQENWALLRLRIDRRAAEKLVERLATERVSLNAQHFKLWNAVVTRLFGSLQKGGLNSDEIRDLDKVSGILEKAQRGQRLARGLSLDGETEEQLRAGSSMPARLLRRANPSREANSSGFRMLSSTVWMLSGLMNFLILLFFSLAWGQAVW